MPTFPLKSPPHRPDGHRRAGMPWHGADVTRLVDGVVTTGLCVGLAVLLRAWLAGPALAGAILAGLLTGTGYVWLAVAITGDAAPGDTRRGRSWDVTAWHVTAWDVALVILAASVAVQAAAPLGA